MILSSGESFHNPSSARGDVQKGVFSKAAGALARGAYGGVREHDKGPRTPLTPFFNIPIMEMGTGGHRSWELRVVLQAMGPCQIWVAASC